jgi:NAD(P)-dependent dehydrogenase (short-subunit alcohol dehydrogenase family)
LDAFGTIHILVNNAAISGKLQHNPLTAIDSQEWHRVISTNLGSVFECTKAVVPTMQRQNYGKIINLATAAFFLGVDNMAHYVASKGAIVGLTRAAARELGRDGIRVNAIAPGLTMNASLSAQGWTRGEIGKAIVASRSIRREEIPEDLIGTLVYLASPDSDFVTGQTIVVDGGGAMH